MKVQKIIFGTTMNGRIPPVVKPHGGVWVQLVLYKERSVSIMVNLTTLMAVVVVSASVPAVPIVMLSSVQIEATPPTLLAVQTLQLTATGTYSDGPVLDARSQVAGSISDNKVTKISPSGLVSIVESADNPVKPALPGGFPNRLYC